MSNQIVMLDVKSIKAHPQNPRKDVGDVSELAESIKANGILQNLTVVKNEDGGYTAIIGHRRLAAAKQAGFEKVPCVIAEMDNAKQVETMMCENMQRSDLTVYEQAEGFQLLLDMDFSIADISQKTGFSKSTIRRRTKLLELDKEGFKASQARNPRLEDYEKIGQIKDEKARNKLLDVIGTNNFNNEYLRLSEAQARAERREELAKICEERGIEKIKSSTLNHTYVGYFRDPAELRDYKFSDRSKYVFTVETYGDGIYLYKQRAAKSQETAQQIREKKIKEAREKLATEAMGIEQRTYKLRCEFLKAYVGKAEDLKIILPIIVQKAADSYNFISLRSIGSACGLIYDDQGCPNAEDVCNRYPQKMMLALALVFLNEDPNKSYVRHSDLDSPYFINEELNQIYYLLTRLGYEMSDEEKQLRDGVHEIYTKYKIK